MQRQVLRAHRDGHLTVLSEQQARELREQARQMADHARQLASWARELAVQGSVDIDGSETPPQAPAPPPAAAGSSGAARAARAACGSSAERARPGSAGCTPSSQ